MIVLLNRDPMCDDKIIVVDPKPATSIHHFIGSERHGTAQRASEIEREHHILLLQRRSSVIDLSDMGQKRT